VEAAIRTGFSDQSHFTNYFNQFIGLAPGTYREIFSEKDGDGGQIEKSKIFNDENG
jgi:transcriptional regulator GlxA family with amidase domain